MNFPDQALQERLVAFSMTTEEAYHTWIENAGNIVPLLKEKPPKGVND
jgi:hypothetical protein